MLNQRIERILYDREAIAQRVRELGEAITKDYAQGKSARDPHGRPLLLVGVLRGAMLFMADLAREIQAEVEFDFISVASYGKGTVSSGQVRLIMDLNVPILERDVLIVEDIVDTGLTWSYLKRSFQARQPSSVRVCALIDKSARREASSTLDYVGFPLEEDAFIVGYGLDYAGLYRNLPFIGTLKPEYIR